VDIGPALRCSGGGRYLDDERTLTRSAGIEKLQAMYPWVDTVDLELFLRGFDAGEEWAFRNHSEQGKLAEVP
jgi:hypothetical protein